MARLSHSIEPERGAERRQAPVIGDRPGLVVTSVAGHPAAEAQVEVLDPPREDRPDRTPHRQELLAIDGQHRPRGSRQVEPLDHALEARNAAHPLDQPEPRSHPRPHPLVLPAVEGPAKRGREQGVVVVLEHPEEWSDRIPRQLDVVVEQEDHRLLERAQDPVERGQPPVLLADHPHAGPPLFHERNRVVPRVVIDHGHAAGHRRGRRGLDDRRQALGQEVPAVVVEHQDVGAVDRQGIHPSQWSCAVHPATVAQTCKMTEVLNR